MREDDNIRKEAADDLHNAIVRAQAMIRVLQRNHGRATTCEQSATQSISDMLRDAELISKYIVDSIG